MPLTPELELAVQTPPLTYPAKSFDGPIEIAPSELPVVSPAVSFSAAIDIPALETASKILRIIDRYRLRKFHNAPEKADEGALKFLALIYSHVKSGDAVPMCLPAFPFKSPNSLTKVLGRLPDRAEELALAHMNGLCLAIQDVYPPGAKLTIISDGLVYNGMLSLDKRLSLHRLTLGKTFWVFQIKMFGLTEKHFERSPSTRALHTSPFLGSVI